MLDASQRVRSMAEGKSYDDYLAMDTDRWAIERQLMIVGEALYQLRADFPDAAAEVPESRGIINFRHVLVHGYSVVENEAVWAIIQNRLPRLEAYLRARLGE